MTHDIEYIVLMNLSLNIIQEQVGFDLTDPILGSIRTPLRSIIHREVRPVIAEKCMVPNKGLPTNAVVYFNFNKHRNALALLYCEISKLLREKIAENTIITTNCVYFMWQSFQETSLTGERTIKMAPKFLTALTSAMYEVQKEYLALLVNSTIYTYAIFLISKELCK